LQATDIVKFIKSLRLRWYGLIERKNKERIQKQLVVARVDMIKKMGRPWNR